MSFEIKHNSLFSVLFAVLMKSAFALPSLDTALHSVAVLMKAAFASSC